MLNDSAVPWTTGFPRKSTVKTHEVLGIHAGAKHPDAERSIDLAECPEVGLRRDS